MQGYAEDMDSVGFSHHCNTWSFECVREVGEEGGQALSRGPRNKGGSVLRSIKRLVSLVVHLKVSSHQPLTSLTSLTSHSHRLGRVVKGNNPNPGRRILPVR